MAERQKIQQSKEAYVFFLRCMDTAVKQEALLLDTIEDDEELNAQRQLLVDNANADLEESGIIGIKAALGEDGLKNCYEAEGRGNKVFFVPAELQKGKKEYSVEYRGLYAKRSSIEIPKVESIMRLQIVHKLLVESENITHPLYDSFLERYATLPFEDYAKLQFVKK